ncbi:hypothetical protein [Bremerella cremea]|uniref:hypothetical protein n=1 Tax=Bremerella cremea TaxID=1031537 RepID=UPI0031EF44D6
MSAWLCLIAVVTAPPTTPESATTNVTTLESLEEQPPLKPHEIRGAIRVALRDEATSKSFNTRRDAIVRICALYAEMMLNEEFAEFEQEKWQAKLSSRLRSVRDDLEKLPKTSTPLHSISDSSDSESSTGAAGGGAIDEPGATELIDLITTTIDPETWDIHGGQGSIFYFSNYRVLVVRQTQDVHQKLGGILPKLKP